MTTRCAGRIVVAGSGGVAEAASHRVLRVVGLAWSVIVLVLLALMLLPLASGAIDAILHP